MHNREPGTWRSLLPPPGDDHDHAEKRRMEC